MDYLKVPEADYEQIRNAIKNEESVVGIDAKETHIIIIHLLGQILERVEQLEERIGRLEEKR